MGQSFAKRASKSKARLTAYEDLLNRNQEKVVDNAKIIIPPGPRLGDLVIESLNLVKGFSERLLVDDLSFKLPPGGIVGVIGPNGAGKQHYSNDNGTRQSRFGSINIGETVKLGYVDQSRDDLNPNSTVWEEISDGLDEIELASGKCRAGHTANVQF